MLRVGLITGGVLIEGSGVLKDFQDLNLETLQRRHSELHCDKKPDRYSIVLVAKLHLELTKPA